MTTIIIIVVVALVFFVTVCVVTFMVWKREAEMRTDSIRAIENNLERLGDRLAADPPPEEKLPDEKLTEEQPDLQEGLHEETCRQAEPQTAAHVTADRLRRTRSRDPFSWVRSDQEAGENLPEETLQQTEVWMQPEPLQQTPQPPNTPEIPVETPQIMPEEEPPAEPVWQPPQEETASQMFQTETGAQEPAVDDFAEPDEDPLAEAAADDITSMEIELPDLDLFTGLGTLDVKAEGTEPADPPRQFGRDIGRSGKKYTAEELEMLIKE